MVYFRKREGKLDGPWTVGVVEEITRSTDGVIRRVLVKYHNASENTSRTTDRSVRRVVKLFNVEEGTWKDDMHIVKEKLAAVGIDVFMDTQTPAPDVQQSELEDIDDTVSKNVSSGDVLNNLVDDAPHTVQVEPIIPGDDLEEAGLGTLGDDANVEAPVQAPLACHCCCLPCPVSPIGEEWPADY